jgi:hypothetical protein
VALVAAILAAMIAVAVPVMTFWLALRLGRTAAVR